MNDSREDHPDEMLAVYVDGTASMGQRAQVEAHLASCPSCRAEVALARGARGALRSLPELDAPELELDLEASPARRGGRRPAALRGAHTSTPSFPARAGRRRDRARPVLHRVAWASGFAAAAAIAALFLFSLGDGRETDDSAAPAIGPEATGTVAGPIEMTDQDYDAASLAELAQQIAPAARDVAAGSQVAPAQPSERSEIAETRPPGAFVGFTMDDALACLEQATGLVAGNLEVRMEAASFEGTPAFVGVFVDPGDGDEPDALLILAAAQDGCLPLHTARQAL